MVAHIQWTNQVTEQTVSILNLHCMNYLKLCNNWCCITFLITHPWWRHHMETVSALLAICAVYSPVPGEFPAQRPVTRSFDVFFDLCLNKRLSKQSWRWWFETLSRPLWRHRNGNLNEMDSLIRRHFPMCFPGYLISFLIHFCWDWVLNI